MSINYATYIHINFNQFIKPPKTTAKYRKVLLYKIYVSWFLVDKKLNITSFPVSIRQKFTN
jgi:hypothetical protein